MSRKIEIIGLFLMILAIIINPLTIEYFFSPDQQFDSIWKYFVIQLFDLILFGIGLIFYTKKIQKKYKKIVILVIIIIFISLIILEILLNVAPQLFGENAKNIAFTKYNYNEEGIFDYDEELKIKFMKPNFTTINYRNGYSWGHKTDSRGFRNEIDREKTEIILLGDSFVYGHGVEFNQTTGYFLENITNYSVYNMGVSNYGPIEENLFLKKHIEEIKPKYVVYVYFSNDLLNLKKVLDLRKNNNESPILKLNIFYKIKSLIFIKTLASQYLQKTNKINEFKPLEYELLWKELERNIVEMNEISKENDAEFIIIPLIHKHFFNGEDINNIEEIAITNNIPISNPELMGRFLNNEEYVLIGDGHLNEKGNKEIAKIISKEL